MIGTRNERGPSVTQAYRHQCIDAKNGFMRRTVWLVRIGVFVSICATAQIEASEGDSEQLADPLFAVLTAGEAAYLWRLSRNAVSDACRRGALRGRRSGKTWLVTVPDMLIYQRGRYWPDRIPVQMQPALERAVALMNR